MTRLLDNRYRILHSLAEGGFGATFLAEDTRTPSQRRCVVKQLKPIAANSAIHDVIKQRFTREAAVLEELGHDHLQIPLLYAYFEEQNEYYLVQEYVEGETLTACIDHCGPWREAQARQLLKQLLPVLVYIHDRGIIHRDIKPDNIILRQRNGIPALIDFGAVKEAMNTAAVNEAPKSIVIGTAGFMAPEQAVGRPMFSSDLYALGLTVIYCLTQKLPHAFDTHATTGEINWQSSAPGISSALAAFLTKAISPIPHGRYATAQAMLKALDELPAIGVPVVTIPPEPVAPVNVSPTSEATSTQVVSPANAPEPASPMTVAMTFDQTTSSVKSPPRKARAWLIFAWLAATIATGGIVFAVMSPDRLPEFLKMPAPPTITSLTPEIAAGTVKQFYQNVSAKAWDEAQSLAADSLAAQFKPEFFQQFDRISVEDLKYTDKSSRAVSLIGNNTYFYPDGTMQKEERTYTVQLVNGRPRITESKFVRVVRSRR